MSNIILVHGAWGGAWEFKSMIKSLQEKGHRAQAIDLPGHGESREAISEVTMDAYVQRVIETVEAESVPVTLVGHSLAGSVISQVAEVIPEKIERLVYVCALLPANGDSPLSLMQSDAKGELLPFIEFSADQSYVTVSDELVKNSLLNDVSDTEQLLAYCLTSE